MSSPARKTILLTRPKETMQVFADVLTGQGYHVLCAPMLSYTPLTPEVLDGDGYDAILFTSTEAVRRFIAVYGSVEKPVLAVGDVTAAAATQEGFKNVLSAGGDAPSLAKVLKGHCETHKIKKIFHAKGVDTATDYQKLVEGQGIGFISADFYKADFIQDFPLDVIAALEKDAVSGVMFFSARTAENFVHLLRRNGLEDAARKMAAICISDRVAQAATGVPFAVVDVAAAPNSKEICDSLGKTLKTMQGWNKRREDKREHRMSEIDDKKSKSTPNEEHKNWDERRTGEERRHRATAPDRKGQIHANNYAGPDRRAGIDRRTFLERQQQRVRAEKQRFISRSLLTMAFLFVPLTLASVFMMAPEYFEMKSRADRVTTVEAQMKQVNDRLYKIQQAQEKQTSLSAAINNQIEKIEGVGGSIKGAAGQMANAAAGMAGVAVADNTNVQQFLSLLTGVGALNRTTAGRTAVVTGTDRLKNILAGWTGDRASLNDAVEVARNQDPTLAALLSGVAKEDLGAAALILTLNEFRTNVGREQPFESDLARVQKFAGDDPKMAASLKKLAPYAQSGVLSREALSQEFKGLAMDIVMAKLQGEDLTVQQQVLKRMDNLVRMRKIDDIEGQSVDAVVARAQLMLDKGDVKGAMAQLQTLEGAPAQAANPWVHQAEGHVMASEASDQLLAALMSQMASPSGFTIDGFVSTVTRGVESGLEGTGLDAIIPAFKKMPGRPGASGTPYPALP